MFWRRILGSRSCNYIYFSSIIKHSQVKHANVRSYSGISGSLNNKYNNFLSKNVKTFEPSASVCCTLFRQCYSKGILDKDTTQLQKQQYDQEVKKITELFPHPRAALNELTAKTPHKIFDIHYKQAVSTPKGAKKKLKVVSNDWTCSYAFIWPEKIKFEATAISKRLAAEKAAIQALHYLYINNRIDNKGLPIYDRDKIEELRNSLQQTIKINISEKSMERIERIWEEYESGIKEIYETTFDNAQKRMISTTPVLNKDSTIDEQDECLESEARLDGEAPDVSESKVPVHPVYGKIITPPSKASLKRREAALRQKFQRYDEEITPLPIDQYASQITSALDSSRVVVIVGAAGCGKSTRAPAAVLRRGGRAAVLVAQPRRVAASGLADRVASELGEEVGETVGYQIRLHAKPPRPPSGSILYCTSGVLLRRLQNNPGLEGCTHVFIDEAHERDVNTDITLLLLKKALDINPRLNVVVMSATLDTEVFTRYFDSCPVIEVPGRTFPVEVSYLEDIQKQFNVNLPSTLENCQKEDGKPQVNCQEVAEVIKAVDRTKPEGAILVFLPGWAEINYTKQLLDAVYSESTHMILPTHSRLSTIDQTKMFAKPMPGVRKIVLATNIAETSITIPDVVYVIDSGAHKENRIKEGTGTASLETVWVSQAGAKQRAGRAGRVQPGHCFRLYTKEKEADFNPHTTPEILRIPLDQTALDCKSYAPDIKIEDFLSQLPEPPSKKAIQFAINDLIDLGALTSAEQLTRLGTMVSSMAVAPRLGAALLHAAVGGAAPSLLRIAATQDHELFAAAADRREEIREFKRAYSDTSDHCALHWIQEELSGVWEQQGRRGGDAWCEPRGLRGDRLAYVRALSNLLLEQVLRTGIVEPSIEAEELTRFSAVDEITVGLLLSGANALLNTKRGVKTKGKLRTVVELFTSKGDRAHIAGESVNYDVTKRHNNSILVYFGGYHSVERRALVVYKTSLIPPHTALLFSKGRIDKEVLSEGSEDTAILTLPRHKLQVHIPVRQADHILKAKEMLWNTFQYYIERDLQTLDYEENTRISRFKVRLMKAIGRILVEGHREYVQGKKVIEEVLIDE